MLSAKKKPLEQLVNYIQVQYRAKMTSRREVPLAPLDLSHHTFVSGRARTPDVAMVAQDFYQTDVWKSMVEPKTKSRRRPAVEKPKEEPKPRKRAVIYQSPIIIPEPVLEKTMVETYWNATSFRRAIAQTCFRWRTMQLSHMINDSMLRRCFSECDGDESAWSHVLVLLYDVWAHVEAHIKYSKAALGRVVYLTLDSSKYDKGQDSSYLLTNVKAFLSEFEQVTESDWRYERVIRYMDRDNRCLLTTRSGINSLVHTKESVEETVSCETGLCSGFNLQVETRESVDVSKLPVVAMPVSVEFCQYKTFTWRDGSYAHTVSSESPVWTLVLKMSWSGPTVLSVDAQIAARLAPRTSIRLELGPVASVVNKSVAGEMTLLSCAGIYAMAAMHVAPRERDVWRWTLARQ